MIFLNINLKLCSHKTFVHIEGLFKFLTCSTIPYKDHLLAGLLQDLYILPLQKTIFSHGRLFQVPQKSQTCVASFNIYLGPD